MKSFLSWGLYVGFCPFYTSINPFFSQGVRRASAFSSAERFYHEKRRNAGTQLCCNNSNGNQSSNMKRKKTCKIFNQSPETRCRKRRFKKFQILMITYAIYLDLSLYSTTPHSLVKNSSEQKYLYIYIHIYIYISLYMPVYKYI